MHPECVEKAPRGAGWYILLEDRKMLEGGPFPSEEAAWAEIARLTPRETPSHYHRDPNAPSVGGSVPAKADRGDHTLS
jgi:hypothetical protein